MSMPDSCHVIMVQSEKILFHCHCSKFCTLDEPANLLKCMTKAFRNLPVLDLKNLARGDLHELESFFKQEFCKIQYLSE